MVRDRRRIDPQTGAVREPRVSVAPDGVGQAQPGTENTASDSGVTELESKLAERTTDLQRLQAEYLNYKRRVDRDRAAVRETAVAVVLTELLPVLDDIDRAREHGELDGGFKAVAESLERTVLGHGLERFGDTGDAFDPHVHEAIAHSYADDVDGPTCRAVLQAGYRLGERILRPARVAVVEPAEVAAPDPDWAAEDLVGEAPAPEVSEVSEPSIENGHDS